MDDEYAIRAPAEGDKPALVTLLNACDEVDQGAPDSDLEDAVWRWRVPGFELDKDGWVVERDGMIVAYATVFDAQTDIFVHPAHRARGIGSELLRLVEVRALEQSGDGVVLKQNITDRADAARRLLEAAGYRRSHHYTRLEMELDGDVPHPRLPKGVTLRSFDPDADSRALYDAYCLAWQQYEGQEWEPEGFDVWVSELQGSDFDPALYLLAEKDDHIIGFAMCFNYPGNKGWVHRLGTLPEHRGRGIGRTLMYEVFRVYRERGVSSIGLTVSSRNVSSARALYKSLGMTEVLRYDNYRKELSVT